MDANGDTLSYIEQTGEVPPTAPTSAGDQYTGLHGLNRLTTFDTGELNSEDTGMLSYTEGEQWSLDALGNWNSETTDGTPTDQTIDSQNQITAKGSDSYSYDYNGNLTQDYDDARDGTTTTEYLYDAWNRLVYINVDDGDNPVGYTNISYSADGDDAISQTQICTGDTETTTNSYYDLASRVIETDVTSSGSGSGSGCSSGCSSGSGPTTLVSQYVWGLGYVNDLLERDDQAGSDGTGVSYGIASGGPTRRLYALTDANSDITAIANHSGGVVERFQYDPYGAQSVLTPSFSSTTDSFTWNVGFQGGVSLNLPEITTTTLIQFDNRIYNTALGRWMQQDPAGYVDGSNLYQFEVSSPIGSLDPTGLVDTVTKGPPVKPAKPVTGTPKPKPTGGVNSNVSSGKTVVVTRPPQPFPSTTQPTGGNQNSGSGTTNSGGNQNGSTGSTNTGGQNSGGPTVTVPPTDPPGRYGVWVTIIQGGQETYQWYDLPRPTTGPTTKPF